MNVARGFGTFVLGHGLRTGAARTITPRACRFATFDSLPPRPVVRCALAVIGTLGVLAVFSACSGSSGSATPDTRPLDPSVRKLQFAWVAERAGQPAGIWIAAGTGDDQKPIVQGPGRFE